MQSLISIARRNLLKSYTYMMLMTLLIMLLGYFVSHTLNLGLTGTGIFLILAGIFNFVAYYFSDRFIIWSTRAKKIDRAMAPEYIELVERLCRQMSLPIPKLYYIDEPAMNAFATGRNQQHSAMVVTRGLLEKLTSEEVAGVVSHELSHIKNLDMLVMSLVAILAGAMSILADMYWRSSIVTHAEERDRSGVLAIVGFVLALLAPISAFLIQLAISRRREYAADALGAKILHNPLPLASALEKISRDRRPLPNVGRAAAHLCISSPLQVSDFIDKLFSTHPPIQDRIKILRSSHV